MQRLTFLLILLLAAAAWAQAEPGYSGYLEQFQRAAAMPALTTEQLNGLLADYSELLLASLEARPENYPLAGLRQQSYYPAALKKLLTSRDPNQRQLGYLTAGAAGDRSQAAVMLKAMQSAHLKAERISAGMALLQLQDAHTLELFDFLVRDEDFKEPHMLPAFFALPPARLRLVGLVRIESPVPRARMLAARSLAGVTDDPRAERALREAVRDWPASQKGAALETLKNMHPGNLAGLLEPVLTLPTLRALALEALALSPTPADQALVRAQPLAADKLNALLNSQNPALVHEWLTLVREQPVPADYRFRVSGNAVLSSDPLLPDLKRALRETKTRRILRELPRALLGHRDGDTVSILRGLLEDADEEVRLAAADGLLGVADPGLVESLPRLLRDPTLRTLGLHKLVVLNRVDGLHDVYTPFLRKGDDRCWYQAAVQYLAVFPRADQRDQLLAALEGDDDAEVRRFAAVALGRLKEPAAVEPIIAALSRDDSPSAYLVALAHLGGERGRAVVAGYAQDPQLAALVRQLLERWGTEGRPARQ